jgi:hypothetical protein
MMRFVVRAGFFLVLLVLLSGCGRGVSSRLGERAVVKGKVTLNGKPLTRGTVVFTPVDPSRGDEQTGDLNASGQYLTSVFPGKYKVSFAENAAVPVNRRSAQATDQQIDVPAAGKDNADFDLR